MGTPRQNTPTEQNKEDNTLVLYRLKLVEDAVKDANLKLDNLDNIKRSDLLEFRDDLAKRITELVGGLQDQVDKLDKEKADQKDVDDLRSLIKGVATIFGTVIAGLVTYYLTIGNK